MNHIASHEAVEWFAVIESGGLRDPAVSLRWDAWRAKPGNCVAYIRVMEMAEELRQMKPITPVRRKDLLRDAARGDP